jgi:hypothetical protein
MECSPLLFGSLHRVLYRLGLCKRYPPACIHGNELEGRSWLCRLGLCKDLASSHLLLRPPLPDGDSHTRWWRPHAAALTSTPASCTYLHTGRRRWPHALELAGGGGRAPRRRQRPQAGCSHGGRRRPPPSRMGSRWRGRRARRGGRRRRGACLAAA